MTRPQGPSKARDRRAYNAAYYLANKETTKARVAAWQAVNREKMRGYQAAYYLANKDQMAEYQAAYREANLEQVRARIATWKAAHPEARVTANHRRRALQHGCAGQHTAKQRRIKFEELGNRCFYCGISGKMTVDHQTPLSRGGTDNIDNLVPACLSCNSRKGTKTLDEFWDHFNTRGRRDENFYTTSHA